jgi:NAD(P)-dependent dehydrogenase (short-subunit alcohol dehydrogenase family)
MPELNFSDIRDKICVVTGGAGVLGSSICHALASVGIHVVIIDINLKAAEDVAKNLTKTYGIDCLGIQANVLDKASLENARGRINTHMGKVDFLVNGAGGNNPKATTQVEQINTEDLKNLDKTFFGLEQDGFDKVFELNFTGTLLPSMVFAEDMLQKQKGAIVNISSMNSYRPLTKIPAYSAAKASINNFTQWLAVHLAKVGVRVNAIAPGFFLTNQNRFLLTDEKTGKPTPRGIKIISNTPIGKYGQPEDLQGAVLYLLSDLSRFVTGIIIPIDGGYSAYGGV